jgi:hypothetical protein
MRRVVWLFPQPVRTAVTATTGTGLSELGRPGTEQTEVRAAGERPRGDVHHVLVRHVGVREDHLVDVVVGDEPLELRLGSDRDALRVAGPGERGRVDPAVDPGDLGRREGDHLDVEVGAQGGLEVVEVPTGGSHHHDPSHAPLLASACCQSGRLRAGAGRADGPVAAADRARTRAGRAVGKGAVPTTGRWDKRRRPGVVDSHGGWEGTSHERAAAAVPRGDLRYASSRAERTAGVGEDPPARPKDPVAPPSLGQPPEGPSARALVRGRPGQPDRPGLHRGLPREPCQGRTRQGARGEGSGLHPRLRRGTGAALGRPGHRSPQPARHARGGPVPPRSPAGTHVRLRHPDPGAPVRRRPSSGPTDHPRCAARSRELP